MASDYRFARQTRSFLTDIRGFLLVSIIAAFTVPAHAHLSDIHTDKLPQQPEIRKAYQDVLGVESMVEGWSPQWRYSTPKALVADKLNTALKELQDAERAAPKNEELLLLTGTVANYAYNLDIDGASDATVAALKKAHTLAPSDPRPEWLLGSFYCGTGSKTLQGMDSLLKVESRFDRQQLSRDFWESYMFCASVTNMPVHVLRAADRLKSLGLPPEDVKWMVDTASKRIVATNLAKTYTPQQVWSARQSPAGTKLFSYACGFGFPDGNQRDWQVYGIRNGVCMVRARLGPFQGNAGKVFPEILVIARPPKPGETLNDFSKSFTKGMGTFQTKTVACPVSACLTYKTRTRANMYPQEGGGQAFVTVFESRAPKFPGLIFESPQTPPVQKGGSQAQYFRPNPEQKRIAGTLYYFVMLDSAQSVIKQATANYVRLLETLVIDTKKSGPH